jgi:DNA-binding transcriptional ArsR family regulator
VEKQVSTEENSSQDNLRRAQKQARAALGLPPSYAPSDKPEAAVVSYAEPAALAYDHEILPRQQPALQLVAKNDEAVALATAKDAKHAAMLQIDALLATAADPEMIEQLRNLKEQIRDAKTIGEITNAIAAAPSSVNAALSKGGDDKVVDIGAMHKQLYANDAVYRAEVDKTMAKSDKEIKAFDKEQAKLDTIATEKGYASPQLDKDRAEMEAEIEDLEKNDPQNPKLIKLQIKRLDIIKDQNEERRKQAEANKDPENIKIFSDHKPIIDEQRKLQLKNLEHLKEKLIEAVERKMIAQGATPEEIKRQTRLQNDFYNDKIKLDSSKPGDEIRDLITQREKDVTLENQKADFVEQQKLNKLNPLYAKASSIDTLPKMEVVQANIAEPVVPNAGPSQQHNSAVEKGSTGF